MNPIPLFLVGAKGLLAAETLRLAATHPGVGSIHAFSRTALSDLREVHPQLPGPLPVSALCELGTQLAAALAIGAAALVLATPHGVSSSLLPELFAELDTLGASTTELRIIDLSDDYRLGDTGSADGWFYGLPELHELPLSARKVAVAGCFATAMQLAVVPLERAGLLQGGQPLVLQGVTASSGSGAVAKQGTHHPYRRADFSPYALGGHRHEKELGHARNFAAPPQIIFLPYSAPLGRGIYLTAHLTLAAGTSEGEVQAAFEHAFAKQPFIQLHKDGVPKLRAVSGSNRAAIGWNLRGGLAQVFVALDNTIKGGAGQGLQCLNALFDFPITTGLPIAGHGY